MKFGRAIVLTSFLLFATVNALAQAGDVDRFVNDEMKARQIPGAALAVVRDGQLIKAEGYGLASIEFNVPAISSTVFELASVTKQFTAAAIMLLVEDGKVGLDDKINKYLPNSPETWKEITVRHLLTHTAGLRSPGKDFVSLVKDGFKMDYTTSEMFGGAAKDPIDFAPGEKWQYSDAGYFLLGMIIEKQSGKRYRDFLSERIFKPLDMQSTTVIDQWEIVKNRAPGYTVRGGKLSRIRRDDQLELPSHYGVLSSVLDMAKWDTGLHSGELLKQSSLDQMWTPVKLNNGTTFPYGFGWYVSNLRGQRAHWHTGVTGTVICHFIDAKLTVIFLSNLGGILGGLPVKPEELAIGVSKFYIKDNVSDAVEETDPKIITLARAILQQAAEEKIDPELFAPPLRTPAFLDRVKQSGAMLKSLGAVESLVLVGRTEQGNNKVYRYRLAFKYTIVFLSMTINGDGKIVGLRLSNE